MVANHLLVELLAGTYVAVALRASIRRMFTLPIDDYNAQRPTIVSFYDALDAESCCLAARWTLGVS